MPFTAYLVEAVRTAGGRKKGALSEWHPADLGAVVVDELVRRTGVNPEHIDDVIFGCVSQIGAQAGNIARNVVLSSSLPESVPGTSVDRQCGSSQQALHFAAQAVMSGTQDVVVAGGVEIMSLVPIGSNIRDGMANGRGLPMSEGIQRRYPDVGMFSQFEGAELVAQKYGISRAEMEKLALASHHRAMKATKAGHFRREIVEVKGINKKTGEEIVVDKDEGIRPNISAEKMAKLRTLKPDGLITAATSSQITDGASAILVVNERGLAKMGPNARARAKIVSLALAGSDPVMMLAGPIPASEKALAEAKLSINDIDLYEVNEAFASVPLAWAKALKADWNKLNVNGGAMALGHPLGSTGTKIMTTLIHELERRGGRYGLQAICEGGGTANACVIEILGPDHPVNAQPRSRL